MSFAGYWTAYAQRYGGRAEKNYKTFNLIEAEWPNLYAAAEWLWQAVKARDGTDRDKGLEDELKNLARYLSVTPGPLLFMGFWEESLKLNARMYELAVASDDWENVGSYSYRIAWLRYLRAETAEASVWADRCADGWERAGNKQMKGLGMYIRGLVAFQKEDYDAATRLLQDSLTAERELNANTSAPVMLTDLSSIARVQRRFDEAERYLSEALSLVEASGATVTIAIVYSHMGGLALERNRWVEAGEWLEKQLLLAREIGRQDLIAYGQYGLARVHEGEGRIDLALPLAQEALAVYLRLRHQAVPAARELVERLKKKIDAPESAE